MGFALWSCCEKQQDLQTEGFNYEPVIKPQHRFLD